MIALKYRALLCIAHYAKMKETKAMVKYVFIIFPKLIDFKK
jgi:hypothetical protein